MDEVSFKTLQDLVTTLEGKIKGLELAFEQLKKSAEDQNVAFEQFKQRVAEHQIKAAAAAGTSIKANAKAEKLTIPTELVKYKGGLYKWAVASFRLPGEHEPISAKEAALDDKTIAKIIAIKGQTILIEQA
jgi:hypothetical protein